MDVEWGISIMEHRLNRSYRLFIVLSSHDWIKFTVLLFVLRDLDWIIFFIWFCNSRYITERFELSVMLLRFQQAICHIQSALSNIPEAAVFNSSHFEVLSPQASVECVWNILVGSKSYGFSGLVRLCPNLICFVQLWVFNISYFLLVVDLDWL